MVAPVMAMAMTMLTEGHPGGRVIQMAQRLDPQSQFYKGGAWWSVESVSFSDSMFAPWKLKTKFLIHTGLCEVKWGFNGFNGYQNVYKFVDSQYGLFNYTAMVQADAVIGTGLMACLELKTLSERWTFCLKLHVWWQFGGAKERSKCCSNRVERSVWLYLR